MTFIFLFPLSNLFYCYCHVLLLYLKQPKQVFFFNPINYILTSFYTHSIYTIIKYILFFFIVNRLNGKERKIGKMTLKEDKTCWTAKVLIPLSEFLALQACDLKVVDASLTKWYQKLKHYKDFANFKVYSKANRERAIAYMESTVVFDFYYFSLLQT